VRTGKGAAFEEAGFALKRDRLSRVPSLAGRQLARALAAVTVTRRL
jgi:hypothetical protein